MAKNNRIKSPAGSALTRAEVDDVVGQLLTLDINEAKVQADLKEAIQRAKDNCAPALEEIRKERKRLHAMAQCWAEAHPEEFVKRRSVRFTHGVLGFRVGQFKLVLAKKGLNLKGALECVMAFMPHFIRNKPEIDAEALIAQRDEPLVQQGLERCGLKVVQEDGFYVQTDAAKSESAEVARG